MSEPVAIALITNVTTVLIVVISRLWSSLEHKETSEKVNQIYKAVNGKS